MDSTTGAQSGSRRLGPVALSIAGSDPCGGAGIQADLKTFHAFGVYGAAVLTTLTAQDTRGVHAIHPVPPAFVAAQLEAVLGDLGAGAIKTGMLGGAEIVEAVASMLRRYAGVPLVCDPVTVSKNGTRLLSREGVARLEVELLPLVTLITPNAQEAAALAGRPVTSRAQMEEAARAIAGAGPQAVLIKGGHVEPEPGVALDLLFFDGRFLEFRSPRIPNAPTHGAGCTLSAAITAALARGEALPQAVETGVGFCHRALTAGGRPGRASGHACPDHRVTALEERCL